MDTDATYTADPTPDAAREAVLDAALPHVPFDGWSDMTFRAAVTDSGVAPGLARALFPRGGLDLAVAYHRRGDRMMAERLAATDLSALIETESAANLKRTWLEVVEDRELVRRGSTLFALPQNAAEGARLIWGTADLIWTTLGDTTRDLNWYSKRATLSAVYGSTVLYWLGDDSLDHQATWDFLDRRIGDVMQIEKLKATMRDNPLGKALLAGPGKLFQKVKAPTIPDDLPGRVMDRFR